MGETKDLITEDPEDITSHSSSGASQITSSSKNQTNIIHNIVEIIDELSREVDFSEDFFARYDSIHNEIKKSGSITLTSLFRELDHLLYQANVNKERYDSFLGKIRDYCVNKKGISLSEIERHISDLKAEDISLFFGIDLDIKYADNICIGAISVDIIFFEIVLVNILTNYQRYGKEGTLKVSFGTDSFSIKSENEIRLFDKDKYSRFREELCKDGDGECIKNDGSNQADFQFSKSYEVGIKKLESYKNWREKYSKSSEDDLEDFTPRQGEQSEEGLEEALSDFYNKIFVGYNNTNISEEIFIEIATQGFREFPYAHGALESAVSIPFFYIFLAGDISKKGTGKGINNVLKPTIEGVFKGTLSIEETDTTFSLKAENLSYL